MKNLFFLLSFMTISFISYSQDKIIKHHGDTIYCKVTELTDKSIIYKFAGEDSSNTISKYLVKKIIFENGIVQKVTNKVIINGIDDWQKVEITALEFDIEGLVQYGEISTKANSVWRDVSLDKMETKAMDRLKRQAAKNRCHIILILRTTGIDQRSDEGVNSTVTGVAYKY